MDCDHRWVVGAGKISGAGDIVCRHCGDEPELHGPKKDHECRWTETYEASGAGPAKLVCGECRATTPLLKWVKQTQHAGAMQAAGDELLRMLRGDPVGFEVLAAIKAWEAVCGRAPKAAEPESLVDVLIKFHGKWYDDRFLHVLKELKQNEG